MYIVIKMAITEINKILSLFTILFFMQSYIESRVVISTKLVYLYPILTLYILLNYIKVKIEYIIDNSI